MSLAGLGLQPELIKRQLRFLGERKGLFPTGLEPGSVNARTMVSILSSRVACEDLAQGGDGHRAETWRETRSPRQREPGSGCPGRQAGPAAGLSIHVFLFCHVQLRES